MLYFEMFYSIDGSYASQGKLGCAVLGNHSTKEVSEYRNQEKWTTASSHTNAPKILINVK